ncbi:MAG TPA: beta-ketoacyl synthase N-terminal-like domain-containing protein, partial [Verrucomicrobiae bacterium]|nr:beta-ketoacyl synthase N-terminal-like domain-containing protein [Verrucomicrobiae bacterium]
MNRIAIVGMGGLFPGAATLSEFWNNILARRESLSPLKETDGLSDLKEHAASQAARRAGYLPEVTFDPAEFGLPPASLEAVSAVQLLSLVVARQTLADAGMLGSKGKCPDLLKRTGVILGVSNGGQTAHGLAAQLDLPQWQRVLQNSGLPSELVGRVSSRLQNLYPRWREESFSGFLGNMVAGRIANRFDLGGANFTVDAASASSLAAIKTAIHELRDGSCDAVLTGGATVENSLFSFVCFHEIQALSKSGRGLPYDVAADGLVLGDGVGMVVLKRLEDAVRDDDTIYAVIQSVGAGSDGRAGGLYSPAQAGQVGAFIRAYEKLPFGPESIGLVEGHGTGTVLGDQVELKSLREVFAKAPPRAIVLGSVKSQIGHSRAAAGTAALIKTALALHHKVLPPVLDAAGPHPELQALESPFYLNPQPRPWIRRQGQPRRAAINGFGFGGTNFHLVMEEFGADHHRPFRLTELPRIVVLHAPTPGLLLQRCETLLEESAPSLTLPEVVPSDHARLGFVLGAPTELGRLLETAIRCLQDRSETAWATDGVWFRAAAASGRVAVIFPEFGGCDASILRALALHQPGFREWLARADDILTIRNEPALSSSSQAGALELSTTATTCATAVFQAAAFQILRDAGLQPCALIGIEKGENVGLWAAGGAAAESLLPRVTTPSDTPTPDPGGELKIPYYSTRTGKRVENSLEAQAILSASDAAPVLFMPVIFALAEPPPVFLIISPESTLAQKALHSMAYEPAVVTLQIEPAGDAEFQFRQAIAQMLVAGVSLPRPDPYLRAEVPPVQSSSSVAVVLDNTFYLSSETRRARIKALEEKAPVATQITGDLHGIHQRFQENQAQYLQTLTQLFERYAGLLERAPTSAERQQVADSLKENAALLENNQAS